MAVQQSSQYVFGPANGGGDIVHFTNKLGQVVSWIDAQGVGDGNLASSGTGSQFGSYLVSVAGGVVSAQNNKTGAVDYSGTDAAVVVNDVLAAMSTTGGTIFFANGIYNINSLTTETASGGSGYSYGIGIPAASSLVASVQFRFIGESTVVWQGEAGSTSANTSGVIFNITSTAVASVGSTQFISAVWQRPTTSVTLVATNCTQELFFENISFRFPTNQRGNECGCAVWFAIGVSYKNCVADFALPYNTIATGSAPVVGTIGSWGLTSTVSGSGNRQEFEDTYVTGYDTGYDFLSEHISGYGTVTSIYCNYPGIFGRTQSAYVYHPSFLAGFTDQENANGFIFGPAMAQGSIVNIPSLDFEFGTSNWYARAIGGMTESNPGYSSGDISYGTIKGGSGVISLPSIWASGGNNFQMSSYMAGARLRQLGAADNFNRADGALGANWQDNTEALTISGNTAVGNTAAAEAVSTYVGAAYLGPQFAQVTVNGTSNSGGPVVFYAGSGTNTGYLLDNGMGGHATIFKVAAGVYTAVATEDGSLGASGDIMRLEAIPNAAGSSVTLIAYRNGVQVLTYTDSSSPYISGVPGMGIYSNASVYLTNWSGGSFSRGSA